jgi:hypothetical protein
MMAKFEVEVSALNVMSGFVKEMRLGKYTDDSLVRTARAIINELNKRDVEKLETVFTLCKSHYMKYWQQYRSQTAIRNMRIRKLNELNRGVE